MTMEGLEAGLLGAAGGAGQTFFTHTMKSLPILGEKDTITGKMISSNELHNRKFLEQQKIIKKTYMVQSL